jgi:hypothetical protein
MRRLLPLLLVCAIAAPAVADGVYFSESFGGTKITDDLGEKMETAFRLRIAIGYRFKKTWAVEGWLAGDLGFMSHEYFDAPPVACRGTSCPTSPDRGHVFDSSTALLMYGVDVKYLKPIAPNLEIYLRGSVGHGVLDSLENGGRGLGVGAGIQLKGKVPVAGLLFWPLFFCNCGPKMTGAIFVDEGFDFYRLRSGGSRPTIDAQLTHLTFGLAAGTDF